MLLLFHCTWHHPTVLLRASSACSADPPRSRSCCASWCNWRQSHQTMSMFSQLRHQILPTIHSQSSFHQNPSVLHTQLNYRFKDWTFINFKICRNLCFHRQKSHWQGLHWVLHMLVVQRHEQFQELPLQLSCSTLIGQSPWSKYCHSWYKLKVLLMQSDQSQASHRCIAWWLILIEH